MAESWSFLVGQRVRGEELDSKFANLLGDIFAMQVPIVERRQVVNVLGDEVGDVRPE